MIRLGSMVRRHFQDSPSKGRAALAEVLSEVTLSPQARACPRKHHQELAQKAANADDISIVELWEAFYGSIHQTVHDDHGWNAIQRLAETAQMKQRLGIPLVEAEVMSTSFQMLTAAKLFTLMTATYELTPAVFEALFGTFDSPYERYNHVIPSDAPEVEHTMEGEDYPTKPLSDRYCATKANKFGAIIPITRETMIADKTGQVVEQAKGLAQSSKYREDQLAGVAFRDAANSGFILDPAEQDAGCYFPEGTRVALYRTAAGSTKVDYETAINKVTSNNLLHWDNVAAALRRLENMTNPKNGQYINVAPGGNYTLVVPVGVMHRGLALKGAGMDGGLTDISANKTAGTEFNVTRVPDALKKIGIQTLNVIVWKQLPSTTTVGQSTWYLCGDSKKQFRKHQVWAPEFQQATPAQLGGDDFRSDVIFKVRAGFKAGFRAVDDKYVIQNTNS